MNITAAIPMTPMIVEIPTGAFLRYTKKPNMIAITINKSDIMAVDAFAELATLSSAPVAGSYVASNVLATIAEKAAMTRRSVRLLIL